jgi:hypothetical protein
LHNREKHGAIARPLNYFFTAFFVILLQLFQVREYNDHKLHNDACVDIRGDAERKDTEPAERSA